MSRIIIVCVCMCACVCVCTSLSLSLSIYLSISLSRYLSIYIYMYIQLTSSTPFVFTPPTSTPLLFTALLHRRWPRPRSNASTHPRAPHSHLASFCGRCLFGGLGRCSCRVCVSGVLFSVGVCVCALLIFLHLLIPSPGCSRGALFARPGRAPNSHLIHTAPFTPPDSHLLIHTSSFTPLVRLR